MSSHLDHMSMEQVCGQLLIVGFDGTVLPNTLEQRIRAGLRGGVILFRRNLPSLETTWRLCTSVRAAFPQNLPAFIGIDEEGGRVSRLPAPFERLPPMRWFGERNDTDLTYSAGAWLGRILAELGFTCNFAPVLDVDSNPNNPVIGDRSLSSDPLRVARHGLTFIRALQAQGVAACGKHFPGHGDTLLDSHIDLPCVQRSRSQLDAIELVPFRSCSNSDLAAMMTAHVVYPALDTDCVAATLSPTILNGVLRRELGFAGVIFSDDLEMGAVSGLDGGIEEASLRALRAGCDAVLICHSEVAADRALRAIVAEASRSESFRRRIEQAASASLRLRLAFQPSMLQEFESIGNLPLSWTVPM